MVALKSSSSWKHCPSVSWIRLLVTAEAFYFLLVLELALSVGSRFLLLPSWRQGWGAEAPPLACALLASGTDLLRCFCAGVAGSHQTCAGVLGADTVGSCGPKPWGSWSQRGERNGRNRSPVV